MSQSRFSDGEIIYRQGEPANGVYRVRAGQVRIERPRDFAEPLSMTVSDGGIFGEAGMLTGDVRDENAVAVGDVSLDYLRRNEFLALVTRQPVLLAAIFGPAFDVAHGPSAIESAGEGAGGGDLFLADALADPPSPPVGVADSHRIRLIPEGRRLRTLVGAEVVEIGALPFLVGRIPEASSRDKFDDIDLAIQDRRPYNLSRRHFAIEVHGDGLSVRDFGSYHGTLVNGLGIGGEAAPKRSPIGLGEHEIVAGRADSLFRFRVVVDKA